MNTTMSVLALALCAGTAMAQNSIVNSQPGTYVDISALAGATALVGAVIADDASYAIASTVTNQVFSSTNVHACTNGYVQFGGAADTNWTNLTINPSPATTNPTGTPGAQTLMPFWDDLYVRGDGGENIYWIQGPAASFGLPAARGNVLIIQWNNVDHYNAGTPTGTAFFQVQIFQNIVGGVAAQMLYQDMVFDNALWDDGASATIGFASGTTGGSLSVSNVSWSQDTAGGVTAGTVLSLIVPGGSVPPSGFGGAAAITGGALLTVTTSSGANPTSTGLNVHADLTSVGGGASVSFVDNGTGGDVTANDGVFSYTLSYPASVNDGDALSIPFVVADAQSRSSNSSINFAADTAGQLPSTARVPVGSGDLAQITGVLSANDVDMFKINICDLANFSVTTLNTAPAIDTQLFLFNLDGTGVVMDDDNPAGTGGLWSRLDSTTGFIPAAGAYYLAVSRFDMDPTSAGAEMWADTPYAAQRTPEGPGSAGVVDAWNGVNANTNGYTIDLTGACYPGGGNVCGAADVGGTGGVPGADNHLDNNDFVVFIDYFFAHNALADQGSTGGVAGADGQWDNNDFVVFIDNFFNAPASCR